MSRQGGGLDFLLLGAPACNEFAAVKIDIPSSAAHDYSERTFTTRPCFLMQFQSGILALMLAS